MDAVIALIEDGHPAPTGRRVAARASVAARTVFRHFDGVDDLYCQAVERYLADVAASITDVPARGPLPVRVALVVHQRRWLFEEVGPVLRASHGRETVVPDLRAVLDGQRWALRRQWARVLAPELLGRGPLGPAMLTTVETVSGWSQWNTLRHQCGHSAPQAERVMAFLVSRVLEPRRDDPAAAGGHPGFSPRPTRGSG
jgi:AcrR family transcriptional regulator